MLTADTTPSDRPTLRLLRRPDLDPMAPTLGASRLSRVRLWVRSRVGRMANWLRVPGAIQPVIIDDALTGQRVQIAVNETYVIITVNGRDLYFRRLSGEFDGTGMSCG